MEKVRLDYRNRNWNIYGTVIVVDSDKEKGFNFPYTLFIPDSINKDSTIIIEGTNVPEDSHESMEEHINNFL